MGLLITAYFWILFTILVMVAAFTRKRDCLGWALISFIISPIMALLFILVLGTAKEEAAK